MKKLFIIFLFLQSSCSAIVINGVQVKNTHKKYVRKSDVAIVIGTVAVGLYLGNNVVPKKLK